MVESFECPNCQATLDYDARSTAVTVRCAYCGSTVIVPDSLRAQHQHHPSKQSSEALAEIVKLVQNGRKIEAIKLFRDTFNVGLKEAKEVVDAIARHEDIHLGGTTFHTESVITTTSTGQTSDGRRGCAALIIALVIIVIGIAAFFIVVPADRTEIIEQITTITESQSEIRTTTEENLVIVTTVESVNVDITELQSEINEALESAVPGTSEENSGPQFAEVVLKIGGEEGTGPGFFNDTRRLAIDGAGNIYTGDYSGGRIQVFSESGEFLATWNAGEDLYMTGMTVDRSGTVYIIKVDTVETYNGMTGEFQGTLNLPGGQTTYFRTAATGPDGSIYLVAEDRLVRLDNSGNIVLDITDPFANIPDFATTRNDAAVDGAGNIYVLGSETIYKLNSQGQFVDQIGSKGEAEDQFFTSPRSIAVDGKGRIFVDDFRGIKVFEGNGRYLATIESPGVSFDMIITDENDLLVMDRNSNEVRKYQLNQ